jgi:hypothetical protein
VKGPRRSRIAFWLSVFAISMVFLAATFYGFLWLMPRIERIIASALGGREIRLSTLGAAAGATITLFLTTLQVIIGARALRLTRESNDETRRSNALGQRAWVVLKWVDRPKHFTTPNAVGEFWIEVVFRNVGKVPADSIHMTAYTHLYEGDPPWPSPVDDGQTSADQVVIPPGRVNRFSFDTRFTRQDIALIIAGKRRACLSLAVAYSDVIGTKGLTSVEAYYEPHAVGPGVGEWVFARHVVR